MTARNKFFTVTSVLIFASALSVAGCSHESSQKKEISSSAPNGTSTAPSSAQAGYTHMALVRVINADPAASSIGVYADNTHVFSDVNYKSVTPYQSISATRHDFEVRTPESDNGKPLAQESKKLDGGDHYTLMTVEQESRKNANELVAFDDNLTPPSAGKAKLRIINASPDLDKVDIYEMGKKASLFSGVAFMKNSDYKEIDPRTLTLQIRRDGKKATVLTVPDLTLEAGKIYTLVIAGRERGKSSLTTIQVQDQFTATPQQGAVAQ
ncbi:MAG: DUF4397 domain-containing protein [Candidatus Acidiferrales bacterium]